jgi:DNA-binding transcriptional MerR regulator
VAYPFTPPNRTALWASLLLTGAQVAALCGLSVRQVSFWAARGYLPRSSRGPERYSGDAIDMAILIKQGRQQGLSVYRAVQEARAYLAAARPPARPARARRGGAR